MVLGGDQKVEGLWQSRRVEPQSAVLGRNETLSSLRGRRGRTDVGCLRHGASPTDRAGGERVRAAAALDRTKESNLEHEPNIVAIIQARMGSTRLPGKVLADIAGEPMLARIVSRVEQATLIQKVVVAISDATEDDRVAEFCERKKIAAFRGSEQNVLDRFYHAAKSHQADVVVRITGDCPLIDPEVMDRVIAAYLRGECDYASNTLICTYPDGLDTEVFSFAALETAWRDARRTADKEHVTPFLRTSRRFKLRNVESELGRSLRHLRWTVDEPCDLEFVRAVYAHFGTKQIFGWRDVLTLLDAQPALGQLNAGQVRNEGYYHTLAQEPAMPPKKRNLTRSQELKRWAEGLIPGASQTLSKGPTQYVQGVAPTFLVRGQGCYVWDADGNQYIDYPMALGPIILGHAYPAVDEAVKRQINDGVVFSLPHPLEIEVAERLVTMVPCAEMVRFAKNGSDATAGAVRLARAYTGKDRIACCGYHGWQDWYIGSTTRSRGVPQAVRELTHPFPYNDPGKLEETLASRPGEFAAVILEPVNFTPPAEGFLEAVNAIAHKH